MTWSYLYFTDVTLVLQEEEYQRVSLANHRLGLLARGLGAALLLVTVSCHFTLLLVMVS